MADKKSRQEQNDQEMQELFDVLDRLQNMSNADEVQEILVDRGEMVPIRPKYHTPQQDPGTLTEDMSTLLIPVDDSEGEVDEDFVMEQVDSLLNSEYEEQEEENLPPAPTDRKNPLKQMGSVVVPVKGDKAGMVVRKVSILLSVIAILAAVAYLAMDFYLMPKMNKDYYDSLAQLYQSQTHMIATGSRYPSGMLASFKDLYDLNNEVRGWLSFHAEGIDGDEPMLDIEYPIMYSGNNEKYRSVDFSGTENKNGALFFDQKNDVESRLSDDRVLIVHGNTVASGQMLSNLNRLVGNVAGARTAPTFTLSTLYNREEYVVFAVVLYDEDQEDTIRYFNPWRTNFVNEEDFLSHVENIKDRSLFDYPVKVMEGDSLVVLTAPTGKTSTELNDGHVLVVARRRRLEEEGVVTKRIIKNRDAIMPYNWYINRGQKPHEYYQPQARTTTTTSVTGTTGTSTTTTTTTTGTGTGTADPTGTTTTTTTTGPLLSGIQQETVPKRR